MCMCVSVDSFWLNGGKEDIETQDGGAELYSKISSDATLGKNRSSYVRLLMYCTATLNMDMQKNNTY